MQPFYFFPRDSLFWFYHCGAVAFVTITTLISMVFLGEPSGFNIVTSLVWALPYSLAVLFFRYSYQKRRWYLFNIPRLMLLIVLYGTIAGVFVVGLVLLITIPMFWHDLLSDNQNFDITGFVVRNLIGGSLNTQLFICSWIFIYANTINSKQKKLTEINNLRLQNSLREARLSNLANQLNPHFLFNALNNIRFMMHESTHNAENMILALSDILRYSLASSELTKVPVGQEMEIIDRYISIVSIQLEQRLRFSKQVPEHLSGYLLPPMVLQMLIENAIKHGIENIEGGGQLELKVVEQETDLVFSVSNDLPLLAAGAALDGRENTGIGLENIRQRLLLLYGNKANLTIKQLNSTHTKPRFIATMTIPKEFK